MSNQPQSTFVLLWQFPDKLREKREQLVSALQEAGVPTKVVFHASEARADVCVANDRKHWATAEAILSKTIRKKAKRNDQA